MSENNGNFNIMTYAAVGKFQLDELGKEYDWVK